MSASSLVGKVVIVTGASAGIGTATVRHLVQAGAFVAAVARRQERLDALGAELTNFAGQYLAIVGDIQEEAFAPELVKQVLVQWGHIDALINNAGLGHDSAMSDIPHDDMRTIFQTNIFGVQYLTQAVLPHFKERRQGHIVNVSSVVSQRPMPYGGVYAASKTALNFTSRAMRIELKPWRIRVSLVYPGLTQTEFGEARLGNRRGSHFGIKGVPASRVAQAIAKALITGREEIYITPATWAFTHICRLYPRSTDWFFTRLMLRKP